MTARARWLLLVISLIMGLGILGMINVLYTNNVDRRTRADLVRIQDERQRDFCELLAVFDDPSAPAPSTERGRQQLDAIRAYRDHRC